MNYLKWKVQYRDYFGNTTTIAAFAWWDDAERYINAKELAMMKDRLTIERI